jgi:hypothetical protein
VSKKVEMASLCASRAGRVSRDAGIRANPVLIDWTPLSALLLSPKRKQRLVYMAYASMFLAIWFGGSRTKRRVSGCWLKAGDFSLVLVLGVAAHLAGEVWVTDTYVDCARPEGGQDGGGEGGRDIGAGAGAGGGAVMVKGTPLI